jgi:hypothetical protein
MGGSNLSDNRQTDPTALSLGRVERNEYFLAQLGWDAGAVVCDRYGYAPVWIPTSG